MTRRGPAEKHGGWTAASPTSPAIPVLTSLRRGDRAPALLRVLTRDPTAQGSVTWNMGLLKETG